jgi:molybdopterin synthase sulfur carrier subunit
MRVLYFALLRERIGLAEEDISPPNGVRTVADLVVWLRGRSEQHDAALANPAMVRVAVNQDYAQPSDAVRPGDEIALFPPVTGG